MFNEHDFRTVSTGSVARAAGVSEGLVFHYFGNKLGLLEACVAERATAVVVEAIGAPPLDFDSLLARVFAWVGTDPLIARLSAADDERVMGAVRRGWQRAVVPPLADALAVEQAAGRCRAGDVFVMARLQFAVVGEAMLMCFTGDGVWVETVDRAVAETARILRAMVA